MQVDPIRPTLKAPGIKLLKLNYDTPLSNFGFKFNLRHYIPAELDALLRGFFASEVIERKCEKAGCAGTHAELSRRIVRLPRVLILHLKRFLFVPSAPAAAAPAGAGAAAGAAAGAGAGAAAADDKAAAAAAVAAEKEKEGVVLGRTTVGTLRLAKVQRRVSVPAELSLEEYVVAPGGRGTGVLRGPLPGAAAGVGGATGAGAAAGAVAGAAAGAGAGEAGVGLTTAETGAVRGRARARGGADGSGACADGAGASALAEPGSAATPAVPRRLNLEAGGDSGGGGGGGGGSGGGGGGAGDIHTKDDIFSFHDGGSPHHSNG